MSRTLGIVPARGGSKRVPRKNVRPLAGRPLVLWALDAARRSTRLDRVVVSTDDDEALDLVRAVDPDVALRRPAELAADDSPPIDYVRHALGELETDDDPFDTIVIIQPTCPFVLASDIDATVELLHESGADTVVSVMRLNHAINPVKLKVLDGDRLLPYLEEERGRMTADELPELYVRNASIYATRRAVVDAGQIIGDDCRGFVMPTERSVDINDELDFRFAEFLQTQLPGG